MQLNKKISHSLALATCGLLSNTAALPVHAELLDDIKIDTAILYYGETDRVQLVEGVINISKDLGDQSIINTKLVIDTLTGASASGAVAQTQVQTFSRPSGYGYYNVDANQTPLDDTFRDTRIQFSGNWIKPLSSDLRVNMGSNFSKEYDYLSVGANTSIERDFFRKNTTISAGTSLQYDSIDPVGGKPLPLASMFIPFSSADDLEFLNGRDDDDKIDPAFAATRDGDSDDKTTVDLLFGLTQTINKRTLMQINYSYSEATGYLNDPYKVVSRVDTSGTTQDILYENRPDKRTKHSLFWQTKYALERGALDIAYRYSSDDWEIDSHTIESRLRVNLDDGSYWQPHIRFYHQSAADFYQPFIIETETLPPYLSADYRLGEMSAYTIGIKYAGTLSNGHKWGVRAEYYQQNAKDIGVQRPGQLQDLDLYPSLQAAILQFSYSW